MGHEWRSQMLVQPNCFNNIMGRTIGFSVYYNSSLMLLNSGHQINHSILKLPFSISSCVVVLEHMQVIPTQICRPAPIQTDSMRVLIIQERLRCRQLRLNRVLVRTSSQISTSMYSLLRTYKHAIQTHSVDNLTQVLDFPNEGYETKRREGKYVTQICAFTYTRVVDKGHQVHQYAPDIESRTRSWSP